MRQSLYLIIAEVFSVVHLRYELVPLYSLVGNEEESYLLTRVERTLCLFCAGPPWIHPCFTFS